ncbi:hypothetical protein [Amnibacterium endophyticum]|uniref:Polymerase nucleotidyl transferase domain-containing protein n=1 Tax=Amnibacterium endophyticum TaxID=2109337 RepID=A0ABW4LEJ1_9MICO
METTVADAALAFAAERYAAADLVAVGGSAARERRPRSDIDLLVVGPAAMFPGDAEEAAYTERWRGELFEVFASTDGGFRRHQLAGAERLRPVSGFLLVEGEVVVDRTDGSLLAWTRGLLAAGPRVERAELDARRYAVTNTLDDLLDAADAVEEAVLAGLLFQRLAELVLLANGQWLASGRWLLRRLERLDAPFAAALGSALAARDRAALERLTLQSLAPLGGRLLEGYSR